jgi:methyl-accepting chemotaxis protein
VQLQKDVAKQEFESSQLRYNATLKISLAALGFGLCLSIFVGFMIIRNLLNKLGGEPNYAAQIATEIANGNLSQTVVVHANDKSSLLYAMQQMQQQNAALVEEAAAAAAFLEQQTYNLTGTMGQFRVVG